MLVRDLLTRIDPDTRPRVQAACDKFNRKVRDLLSQELLRFKLAWKADDGAEHSGACAVQLDDVGAPSMVADTRLDERFHLAALLSMHLPELAALARSSTEVSLVLKNHQALLREHLDTYGAKLALDTTASVAKAMLTLASIEGFDLTTTILSVDRDVLGSYEYDAGESRHSTLKSPNPTIRIYWGIIGLVAMVLSVSVEGLTGVVLAHELSHAYTHIGFDRDGNRWMGADFFASSHVLKESLAQYYTFLIASRLSGQHPEILDAYKKLLPKQPSAYQGHIPWLSDASPEAVASTLAPESSPHLELRGRGVSWHRPSPVCPWQSFLTWTPLQSTDLLKTSSARTFTPSVCSRWRAG